MPFKLGNTTISGLKLGNANISAAYIGSTQVFSSAPAGPVAGDSLTSLSSVFYNTDQYYAYRVNFAGVDSNSNPVFAFGYRDDSTNQAKAILIRINPDNSITAGTPDLFYTGTGSLDPLEDVLIVTDNGDSNHCIMVYQDRGNSPFELYARAASFDLDNLTFTKGAQLTVFTGSIDTMTLGAYLGNGKYAVGHRSSQVPVYLLERSGTTVTRNTSGNTSMAMPGNVYNRLQGYAPSGNIYRVAGTSSTGSTAFNAKYWNNGSPSSSPSTISPITGLNSVIVSQFCALDTASKGLLVSSDGTTTKAAVTNVSWPTSGTAAPTLSSGSQVTLTDDVLDRRMLLAKGENNTAHLIYYSGTSWKERILSASGTTLTEGSAVEIPTLTSNQTNFGDMAYYNDGTWKYLLGIVDNSSSNNPDVYVKRF